jgi:serine/threonine-protein kinase
MQKWQGIEPLGRIDPGDELAERYRVLAELGRGGTANVYLAVSRGPGGFNKLLVLKVPREDIAEDPDACDAFLREARVAARLNHPNIVQTFEVTEHGGLPLIVMEHLRGHTLSAVLSRARKVSSAEDVDSDKLVFPLAAELRVLVEALRGLHHAHELSDFDGNPLGLVHRDISPQNVFVTYDGQVKLVDFGLAKLAWVETHSRMILGKLRYMAPEQLLCQPIDRRADLFSIGVMLWEALADQRLWQGKSQAEVETELLKGEIPAPTTVNPDIPPGLERVCMTALAADPARRFATAADMETALLEAAEGHFALAEPPVLGKAVSALFERERLEADALVQTHLASAKLAGAVSASGEQHSEQTLRSMGSRRARAGQRRSRALPVLAVVLLGLIGVAAATWLSGTPRPEGSPASSQVATTSAPVAPVASPRPPAAAAQSESGPAAAVSVRLSVEALPSNARLFFDGRPLPANPHVWSHPRDSEPHRVRAEAPGYYPREIEIRPERDVDVELTLRPGTLPAPPRSAETTGSPAGSAVDDCREPSYFDRRGIKRYRPECLRRGQ